MQLQRGLTQSFLPSSFAWASVSYICPVPRWIFLHMLCTLTRSCNWQCASIARFPQAGNGCDGTGVQELLMLPAQLTMAPRCTQWSLTSGNWLTSLSLPGELIHQYDSGQS